LPGSPEPTARDERAARRVLVLAAVALLAVLIGVVVIVVTKVVGDDGSSGERSGAAPTTGRGVVEAIGPVKGTAVPAYVDERAAALDKATGTRLAVVSLAGYATEADARAAVGKLEVVAFLAAVPGGGPQVVADSLAGWAVRARRDALAERDEIEDLLPTVDDPEFASFYRDELSRLARVAGGAKADGPVVFALVVRGPSVELRALAKAPAARLVDVGGGASATADVEYTALRPEEVDRAGTPDLRP
jgi:hypothetical protein